MALEIHKPKPVHSWREFGTEIGVVVIGIAIALGGDQVIRALERRAEVAEARLALKSEIAANAHAAKYNLEYDRCLLGLGARIGEWAKGGRQLPVGLAPTPWLNAGAVNWDVVKTGAAAHMPLHERLVYARVYHDIDLGGYSQPQVDAWLRLASAGAKAKLGPEEAERVLGDVAQERLLDNAGAASSRRILLDAKAAGVEPVALSAEERAFLTKFCKSVGVSPQLD